MRYSNRMRAAKGAPRAFTLVELLVAIAIIVVLLSITLLFMPKREVRLASQGADQLQTYIASAKSRALRDNAPRGIRLIGNTSTGYREFQYVEVPEPYAPGSALTIPANGNTSSPTSVTLAGDHTASIGNGDMLEITYGAGSIHRILSRSLVSGNTQLNLASSPPVATQAQLVLSNNYRVIRQPRPLLGETNLLLPDKVFVVPMANAANPSWWLPSQNLPSAYGDPNTLQIIFSPSGQVMNATTGRIVLVVMDDNNISKPTYLCVYSHTGAVAAHPDLAATQDGLSSGQ